MKNLFYILAFLILFSCVKDNENEIHPYELHEITLGERIAMESSGLINVQEEGPNWKEIKQRGYLNLITENSLTSYYIYKGKQLGYEYEVLEQFCKKIGLKLNVVVARDLHEMFYLLKTGQGDIIGNNLNPSEERSRFLNLSRQYDHVHQVLLSKLSDTISDISQLDNATIHIRNSSIFEKILDSVQKFHQITFNIIRTDNEQEELIELLHHGKIDYTLADNNIASINQTFYDSIKVLKALSPEEPVVWGLRKKDTAMLRELNGWIAKNYKGNILNYIKQKYFSMSNIQEKVLHDEFYTGKTGHLSPYDELIVKSVEGTRFDWVWVSALIFQESRFDNRKKSWVGASGLMQLMPSTAKAFGAYRGAPPSVNVKAGVKYLNYLDQYWKDSIPNVSERNHFILASYNAGPGHVEDARRLTRKYGMNPNLWFDNVAEYLLLKSKKQYYHDPVVRYGYCRGREPYNYVMDINLRHKEYLQILEASENIKKTQVAKSFMNILSEQIK